ncbi:Tho complex subunit 7-domain-containing protein [Schizothecium vesticola]|uniref:Tho complex subunit 7-domain-containing protein n=1 Tax=Schizothecium vesticola TaxID=314040 RepID=A0AA40EV80_9PEZI|nr:Tho complex subunit 7-domain-containing protein [Schizothecium vesticola]
MATWGYLDGDEENELHKSRLLNVEEKPFKRVTKRLSTLNAIIISKARQTFTPPPETNGAPAADQDAQSQAAPSGDQLPSDLAQMKEDITLDLAAFDSSIARLQFLLTANERERERYAAERERIVTSSQAVRDNTSELRLKLEQARATLEQRKKFDELADKITSNPSLRPRAEQMSNLKKLEEEIVELEAESKTYGVTWQERRDQFAKIMDESMRLRRLIRDEKEEVERREGMGDEADTPRPGLASGNATPRPESGLLPRSGMESGDTGTTPRALSTTGGRTPARDATPAQDSQPFLTAHKARVSGLDGFSRNGSMAPSREPTPDGREKEQGQVQEQSPADDEGEEPDSPLTPLPSDDPPQILIDGQDTMDTT